MKIEITEILAALTALASAGGFSAVFNSRLKTKHQKEIDTIKDKQQDKNIKEINTKIDILAENFNELSVNFNEMRMDIQKIKDLQKDSLFLSEIENKTKNMIDNIMNIKELCNTELKHGIIKGQSKYVELIKYIIANEFKKSTLDIKEEAYFYLKAVKFNIVPGKLNLKNPEEFLERVENEILKPSLESFLLKYSEFQNFTNGERREALKINCLELIKKICVELIDFYKKNLSL